MRLAECALNLGVPEGAFAADVPAHLPLRHALEALAEAGMVNPGTALRRLGPFSESDLLQEPRRRA
jgi:hypothetical protein